MVLRHLGKILEICRWFNYHTLKIFDDCKIDVNTHTHVHMNTEGYNRARIRSDCVSSVSNAKTSISYEQLLQNIGETSYEE